MSKGARQLLDRGARVHFLRDPSRVAVVATVRQARRLPAGVAAAFVHRVALEMPDEEGRRAILTQLSRDVGLGRDVDMERLGKITAVRRRPDRSAASSSCLLT